MGFPLWLTSRALLLLLRVVSCVLLHRSASDIDEATWLIEHDGEIDTSTDGRKNAKKRTQELKKRAAAAKEQKKEAIEKKEKKDKKEKKSKKKAKTEKKEKVMECKPAVRADEIKERKKEQRELDKRRKKRSREREKALAREAKKQKRGRTPSLSTDPATEEEDNSCLDSDKRARATAIVNSYVTRMANAEDYKSLALGGVLAIPAAMVDSNGLLGLTLAFRAAAGELDMPGDSGGGGGGGGGATETNPNASSKLKPWEAIDCDLPRTHQERTERLEKKMKLLEKEVERVRANVARRRALAAQALEHRAAIERKIAENDFLARVNHFKKKKKVTPLTTTTKVITAASALDESAPVQQHPAEEEASMTANDDDAEEEEDSMGIDNDNSTHKSIDHDGGGADRQEVGDIVVD
jgi:outer membrane biosynthesis protein TonB